MSGKHDYDILFFSFHPQNCTSCPLDVSSNIRGNTVCVPDCASLSDPQVQLTAASDVLNPVKFGFLQQMAAEFSWGADVRCRFTPVQLVLNRRLNDLYSTTEDTRRGHTGLDTHCSHH
jgi:hypothetical protein